MYHEAVTSLRLEVSAHEVGRTWAVITVLQMWRWKMLDWKITDQIARGGETCNKTAAFRPVLSFSVSPRPIRSVIFRSCAFNSRASVLQVPAVLRRRMPRPSAEIGAVADSTPAASEDELTQRIDVSSLTTTTPWCWSPLVSVMGSVMVSRLLLLLLLLMLVRDVGEQRVQSRQELVVLDAQSGSVLLVVVAANRRSFVCTHTPTHLHTYTPTPTHPHTHTHPHTPTHPHIIIHNSRRICNVDVKGCQWRVNAGAHQLVTANVPLQRVLRGVRGMVWERPNRQSARRTRVRYSRPITVTAFCQPFPTDCTTTG